MKRKWEDNITIHLTDVGCSETELTQNSVQCWVLVLTVMNLWSLLLESFGLIRHKPHLHLSDNFQFIPAKYNI
jgi:hypothetical protein